MAVILTGVLIVSAYAVTLLFTQTVPSKTIKTPNGGMATANCTTLTLTPDLQYSTVAQAGFLNATCSGTSAFTVTQSGVFVYYADGPAPVSSSSNTGYERIYLLNYSIWQNSACRQAGYGLTLPTDAYATVALSTGDYVYCFQYNLAAYYSNAPLSLPSFPLTWSSP